MLHAYDASERERKRAREREGPKLVIFLTRCLCKSGQNVSRKGYPPSGAGDRNNNSPGTEIIKKNTCSPEHRPLQQHLHRHHRYLHHHHDTLDTTFLIPLYYGYFIYTDTIIFLCFLFRRAATAREHRRRRRPAAGAVQKGENKKQKTGRGLQVPALSTSARTGRRRRRRTLRTSTYFFYF